MADPVNLNRFKKQKARAEKRARADQNAIKFGLSKAHRDLEKTQNTAQISKIEGHKLETTETPSTQSDTNLSD